MKHGGGMPKKGGSSNNSGGAAQAKSGKHYTPLCRSSQYSTTMDAMTNRTRTQYPHLDVNYHYQGISEDQGGNILGYKPE